jgi:hypothetical protein
MKALQSLDLVVSYLFFSLHLLVLPSAAALGTLAILGTWSLWTSKLFEKKQTELLTMRDGC